MRLGIWREFFESESFKISHNNWNLAGELFSEKKEENSIFCWIDVLSELEFLLKEFKILFSTHLSSPFIGLAKGKNWVYSPKNSHWKKIYFSIFSKIYFPKRERVEQWNPSLSCRFDWEWQIFVFKTSGQTQIFENSRIMFFSNLS